MVEITNTKYIIVAVIIGVLLYITYPLYQNKTLFVGQAPIFWVILPFVIGFGIYFALRQDVSVLEKLKIVAKKGEETVYTEEAMVCWDKFANMVEYSQLDTVIGNLQWTKMADHWFFIVPTISGQKYVTLNGLHGKPLNPEIIDRSTMKEIGFEDMKDKERSGKSRLVHDLIKSSSRFDVDKITKMLGESGLE